jgi:hypothetical protein
MTQEQEISNVTGWRKSAWEASQLFAVIYVACYNLRENNRYMRSEKRATKTLVTSLSSIMLIIVHYEQISFLPRPLGHFRFKGCYRYQLIHENYLLLAVFLFITGTSKIGLMQVTSIFFSTLIVVAGLLDVVIIT